ncbi:MAG: hypothetical protein COY19_06875 [Candidatus Marinimicrobia bacterium CG_4_10_14_0_2_um_filter_48_9]|nr:MAG: hypothetical protein COY19_06875 [Candidatus Marinimicrobia bacterium CG_4_10_14_0_2_um_filter_48_9]
MKRSIALPAILMVIPGYRLIAPAVTIMRLLRFGIMLSVTTRRLVIYAILSLGSTFLHLTTMASIAVVTIVILMILIRQRRRTMQLRISVANVRFVIQTKPGHLPFLITALPIQVFH